MKLLRLLKIDGITIHYESIKLFSTVENTVYYITPNNFLYLTMGKKKFEVVPKRARTWIEPIFKTK